MSERAEFRVVQKATVAFDRVQRSKDDVEARPLARRCLERDQHVVDPIQALPAFDDEFADVVLIVAHGGRHRPVRKTNSETQTPQTQRDATRRLGARSTTELTFNHFRPKSRRTSRLNRFCRDDSLGEHRKPTFAGITRTTGSRCSGPIPAQSSCCRWPRHRADKWPRASEDRIRS